MNSWSEALYDHHAFNWYSQRGLLAIPFSDWLQSGHWSDRFVSDVRIFGVTGNAITPRGSLAWQHAFGDTTPAQAFAFASSGIPFGISVCHSPRTAR